MVLRRFKARSATYHESTDAHVAGGNTLESGLSGIGTRTFPLQNGGTARPKPQGAYNRVRQSMGDPSQVLGGARVDSRGRYVNPKP